MTRTSPLDQVDAMQMARCYCLLVNADPDAIGLRRRVSEARWRRYRDIAEAPARKSPDRGAPPETIGT